MAEHWWIWRETADVADNSRSMVLVRELEKRTKKTAEVYHTRSMGGELLTGLNQLPMPIQPF